MGNLKDNAKEKFNKVKNISKEKFLKKKKELMTKFERRVNQAAEFRETESWMQTLDKLSFIFGVVLLVTFVYILGRYPHSHFYVFYSSLVPTMVLIRFVDYKPKRSHYFLLDFCYFGGATVLLYVVFFPKS